MKRILLLSLVCLAAAHALAFAAAPTEFQMWDRAKFGATAHIYDSFPDEGSLPLATAKWYFSGYGSKTPVDLGGGNYGIQITDFTDTGYAQYSKSFNFSDYAVAARFRVDSQTSKGNLLQISGKWDSPALAIGIRDGHYWMIQYNTDTRIADLGVVTPGQFVEAGLYVDANNGLAGYWLGSKGGNYRVTSMANTGAHVEFGAETYWGPGGTSTVTYDWVGVYNVMVPEPGSLLALGSGLIGFVGFIVRRRRA